MLAATLLAAVITACQSGIVVASESVSARIAVPAAISSVAIPTTVLLMFLMLPIILAIEPERFFRVILFRPTLSLI